MSKLSDLSVEELQGKLKSARSIQITTSTIFVLIILAWIVLGYWQTNLPVFISTVAMAVVLFASTSMAPRSIAAELAKRTQSPEA